MLYELALILSTLGFVLSWYAWHIEQDAGKRKGFRALCDISSKVSCSKVFSSGYGKHFGVSNSIWGLLFYALCMLLSWMHEFTYVFFLSLLAVIGSIYLGYILYTRVRVFCVVCGTIYLVNVFLAIASYKLAF